MVGQAKQAYNYLYKGFEDIATKSIKNLKKSVR